VQHRYFATNLQIFAGLMWWHNHVWWNERTSCKILDRAADEYRRPAQVGASWVGLLIAQLITCKVPVHVSAVADQGPTGDTASLPHL